MEKDYKELFNLKRSKLKSNLTNDPKHNYSTKYFINPEDYSLLMIGYINGESSIDTNNWIEIPEFIYNNFQQELDNYFKYIKPKFSNKEIYDNLLLPGFIYNRLKFVDDYNKNELDKKEAREYLENYYKSIGYNALNMPMIPFGQSVIEEANKIKQIQSGLNSNTQFNQGYELPNGFQSVRLKINQDMLEASKQLKDALSTLELFKYIPLLRTWGASNIATQQARLHNKEGKLAADMESTFGAVGDFADLFYGGGLGTVAKTYAGDVAGRYIGEKYDHPVLGGMIGATLTGASPLLYNWTRTNIGSKGSRLAYVMNKNMGYPTETEFLPYNINLNINQHSKENVNANFNNFVSDELPPEDLFYDPEKFYPIYGDQYANVDGFSVDKRNLNWYQEHYPNTENVLFGPKTPEFDFNKSTPTIISDVPLNDMLSLLNYFLNVVLPLARRRGYSLLLPDIYPKYYREMPYWLINDLGETKKITPYNNRLGGWFNPNDNTAYINITSPNKYSNILHEYISHGTDSLLPLGDMKVYGDLAQFLVDNLRFRLSGNNTFNIPQSINAQEMRSSINQARNEWIESGKINIKSDGTIDTSNLSDNDILNTLSTINGYGEDYVRMFNTLQLNKRLQWLRSIRRAIEILPLVGLGTTMLNKN